MKEHVRRVYEFTWGSRWLNTLAAAGGKTRLMYLQTKIIFFKYLQTKINFSKYLQMKINSTSTLLQSSFEFGVSGIGVELIQ